MRVGPERNGGLRFERGFLAGCWIRGSEKKIAAIADHPLFATVEEMDLGEDCAAVLRASELRALRALSIENQVIELVLERPIDEDTRGAILRRLKKLIA